MIAEKKIAGNANEWMRQKILNSTILKLFLRHLVEKDYSFAN